jgi:ubiquitin carboxyl-terminal hydrolase L3
MDNQGTQNFNWAALESNPEVFTEYMHKIGLSENLQIGEVFGFDEELLAFLP